MSAPADFLRYGGKLWYNLRVVSRVGRRLHSLIYICWSLPRRPTLDARPRAAQPRGASSKFFMTIQENVLLAPFTTFRIGGAARFFAQVRSVDDVLAAVTFVEGKKVSGENLPIFVLGGGSNVLISDEGFNGLVIKNEIKGISEEDAGAGNGAALARIVAGAGENWDALVKYTVEEKSLYGLENLSLIPGTVGAAPVQNIGAYGQEVKDTIEWVEVYNPSTRKIERVSNADCRFDYRDSVFKHARKDNIILRVSFLLKKQGQLSTDYKDVQKYFAEMKAEPSLCGVREAIIKIRTAKLPDIAKVGMAGSFFKNVTIPKADYEKLLIKYPTMPAFSTSAAKTANPAANQMVKLPTAWILDNVCGFKGARRGNVGVYKNQALVLVNFGQGTASEIKALAGEMIACVKEKTGITISPEVEFVV